jgi:hypothetical protein
MEWYKSFENVTKLILLCAGLVLIFTHETEIGLSILMSTGLLAATKQMDTNKKNGNGGSTAAIILFCLCLTLGFASCQTMKALPSAVIDLNLHVYDVYDQYVTDDSTLTETDKIDMLRATEFLRSIFLALQSGMNSIDAMMLLPPPPMTKPAVEK